MKKLTAGILASLIGLVSANSADAAVASKAYVDGAIETLDADYVGVTTNANNYGFVAGVEEVDGKIKTTGGQLVLKPNEDGYTNNLTIEKKQEIDGTFTYTIGAAQQIDNDTKYTEGNGVTISEGNVISADIAEGDNVKITTDAEGKMTISATDTKYTFVDDIVVDENGAYHTSYYDATNTDVKTAEQETAAGDGWYVLMRKQNGTEADGVTPKYIYQWENLDRSYDANEISVAHDE